LGVIGGEVIAIPVVKTAAHKANDYLAKVFTYIGLALIVISVTFYSKSTPFPSIYAIPPVLGTCLLICFADRKSFVNSLLTSKVAIFIGLISYRAYLWHQPLFAFARLATSHEPSICSMLGLSFLSLFFAYFSWKYIEAPFRKHETFKQKDLFRLSGISLFLTIVLVLFLHFNYHFKAKVRILSMLSLHLIAVH
jgi:peptidoglycan/LPS O-acetylase OafA/YrhL